jgi:hypothetical protein
MLQPLGEKTFMLISNVPKKEGALSCSHLLPSTKTLEAMTWATNAQFLKEAIRAMTSKKINHSPR